MWTEVHSILWREKLASNTVVFCLAKNVLDGVSKLVVANSYGNSAAAPEMSSPISQSGFRVVFEKYVCWAAFEKLHDLFIGHAFWKGGKQVGHDRDEVYLDVLPWSGFANWSFAKIFVLELRKHAVSVVCLPIHMPKVYSDLMVIMFQFNVYKFHFGSPRIFCGADANSEKLVSAPTFAARSIFYLKR